MKLSTVITGWSVVLLISVGVWAQEAPRRERGGEPGRPESPRQPGVERAPRESALPRPPLDGEGPMRRPMPLMEQLERLRGWLELVERYTRFSQDPTSAAIGAVVTANDMLRPQGPEAAIEYFSKLLPDVKNPAVQRVIRLQLVDHYRVTGQRDKAMEILRDMIVSAPADGGRTRPDQPPARP